MRPESLYRMCVGKFAYRTFGKAERARLRREKHGAPPLRAYYCEICLKFHLTSKPDPNAPRPVKNQTTSAMEPQPKPIIERKKIYYPPEHTDNPRLILPYVPSGPRPAYTPEIELTPKPFSPKLNIKFHVFKELAKRQHPEMGKAKLKAAARKLRAKALTPNGWDVRRDAARLQSQGVAQ